MMRALIFASAAPMSLVAASTMPVGAVGVCSLGRTSVAPYRSYRVAWFQVVNTMSGLAKLPRTKRRLLSAVLFNGGLSADQCVPPSVETR